MNWAQEATVVGLDDGYNNIKVVTADGFKISVPSRAKVGASTRVALDGAGDETGVFEYETEGTRYSAGDVQGDDTTFDQYAHSPLNRVLVHHALRVARAQGGIDGGKVAIVSGIPVREYFTGASSNPKNEMFIKKKQDNLAIPVEAIGADSIEIMQNLVTAQGFAAWFDWVIEVTGDEVLLNPEKRRESVAIVDIGGRTTDFAVISNGTVDTSASGSINCGMLMMRDYLRNEIKVSLNLPAAPSDVRIDEAIKTGRIKVHHVHHDVAQILKDAENMLVSRIRTETKVKLGSGQELDRVIFIGGGAKALDEKGLLKEWFVHQELSVDPLFANASGMMKYGRFVA
ncbi:ParM/StbA family protein [Alcanivorax sp. 1008]|uniref:ParM/StbA family protein n=1 Tax=Alcanivorax sp. 1008 TaxID=2816853 RepID=UPI001D25FABD|nr:ParM/StbA family protein [Alcanivorax sp. 1008]MCC1496726.1 ParM/StbA family protein [Alcanivorax sp. 1008]